MSFIILEPYSHRSLCSTVLHIEKRAAAFMWAQHTVPHPQSFTAELHTQLNAAFCFSECCTVPALSHCAVFFHYMLLMAQYGLGTVKVCWHSSLICLTPAHFQTLLGGFVVLLLHVRQTCITNCGRNHDVYIASPEHTWAERHVQQTMRAGTSSSHPDASVWSVERTAASTSHASSFSKSNQPW